MITSASWPAVRFSSTARCESSLTEIQTALHHVHDDGLHIHQFEKLETREPDRTGADDEHGLTRLGIPALHGVIADGERLDERELVIGKIVARMQLAGGHCEDALAQTAVVMNADDLDAGAAVRHTFFRSRGSWIVDIWFQRAPVTGLHVCDVTGDGHDLKAELVTGRARIGEKREIPEIAGKVGAADAHAMGADQCFAGTRRGRFR